MSWYYPKEKKLTNKDIEAYAEACWNIICELGDGGGGKVYDPLTIEGKTAHSYVFNLEDGGRHHKFKDLEHLRRMILEETLEEIKWIMDENFKDWKKEKLNKNK